MKATTAFLLENQCPLLRGYEFLKAALVLVLEDEQKLESLIKCVYYEVAEQFQTDTINVEKCIRALSTKWWACNKIGNMFDQRPSNKLLIQRIIEHIKLNNILDTKPPKGYIQPEDIEYSATAYLFGLYS